MKISDFPETRVIVIDPHGDSGKTLLSQINNLPIKWEMFSNGNPLATPFDMLVSAGGGQDTSVELNRADIDETLEEESETVEQILAGNFEYERGELYDGAFNCALAALVKNGTLEWDTDLTVRFNVWW